MVVITEECIECGSCVEECPQEAISPEGQSASMSSIRNCASSAWPAWMPAPAAQLSRCRTSCRKSTPEIQPNLGVLLCPGCLPDAAKLALVPGRANCFPSCENARRFNFHDLVRHVRLNHLQPRRFREVQKPGKGAQ